MVNKLKSRTARVRLQSSAINPSPGRTAILGALMVCVVSVCLVGCDQGVTVTAQNATDHEVIIREAATQWLLPAHGNGVILDQLGPIATFGTRTYEVLDRASCATLGVEVVDFATTPAVTIQVGNDGRVELTSPSPSADGGLLAKTSLCAGPAAGWTLWVVNSSSVSYFLRATDVHHISQGAAVGPDAAGAVFHGYDGATTVEVLDSACRVLDQLDRVGWGDSTVTIRDGSFAIQAGDGGANRDIQLLPSDACP